MPRITADTALTAERPSTLHAPDGLAPSAMAHVSPELIEKLKQPAAIRFIRFGEGSSWATRAFDTGTILFKYRNVSHDACAAGDWDDVRRQLLADGRKVGAIGNDIRELRDFYELDDCLWVTIADGHLWWAFGEGSVLPTGDDGADQPFRYRSTVDAWRRHDLKGEPLTLHRLSSALTKVNSYQRSLCRFGQNEGYLLRKIRGERLPQAELAQTTANELEHALASLVPHLDWRDLEILVDLIFTQGGWRRVSALGTGETDLDLLLANPITGERAWVQIKSSANQSSLDDYLDRFRRHGTAERFYFICHSPKGKLTLPDELIAQLWTAPELGRQALLAGLADWVIARTG